MSRVYLAICVLLFSTAAAAQTVFLSGTQPGVSNPGTDATAPLVVKGVVGGTDNVSGGTAGAGSSPSVAAGTGGDGTGVGHNTSGGVGGSITLTTGDGGASIGNAAGASGGNLSLNLGSAGSVGTGTAGINGTLFLSAPNNTGNTAGGNFANPLFCGPTFTSICFFWLYNGTASTYTVLGWRDVISGSNMVCGGLDDPRSPPLEHVRHSFLRRE
jgi:hypothetical protein